jgi:hypothetical protein
VTLCDAAAAFIIAVLIMISLMKAALIIHVAFFVRQARNKVLKQ